MRGIRAPPVSGAVTRSCGRDVTRARVRVCGVAPAATAAAAPPQLLHVCGAVLRRRAKITLTRSLREESRTRALLCEP